MNKYSAFSIIGPRMIGPSSSHTAGAAKLAGIARKIAKRDIAKATLTLYGSFAETGRGHGTDKALVAGLLGMESDDARLRYSLLLAEEAGIEITINFSDEERDHPNSVMIEITSSDGTVTVVEGESIGGGNVNISAINGMNLELSGDYPALFVHYNDHPGVISFVSKLLADLNTNVAGMRVFRTGRGSDACMLLEMDTPVPDSVIQAIYDMDDTVYEVRTIW